MKLLKAVLTVVLLAQNVVFASPLVVRSASEAPSSDIIERDADGNYPGDGSPGAWAVLREAEARRTSPNEDDPKRIMARRLVKRDGYDCRGSGLCWSVDSTACIGASWRYNDNQWYSWYVSRCERTCTAIYTCENGDYGGGWPGWFLIQKMGDIYGPAGCRMCGSVWFWGTCRVTFNYAAGCREYG